MNYKKIILKRPLLIIVFLLAFFLFSGNNTRAVTVSPLNFELNSNPGDRIDNYIKIYNDTDSEISVKMEIEDFAASGERGEVLLKADDSISTYSLRKWVSMNPEVFNLAPRSTQVVQFSISVPENAEPGGHYASILASISSAGVESTGVGVAQKVGSLLLLSVSGELFEKMDITEFSAPEFSEYGPKELVVKFSNSGTIHSKPRGFVIIKNMLGAEVAKIDIPQLNVLPQSSRKINIPVKLDNQIGKYEASLVAIYGASNEPVSAVVRYWVFPWKFIFGGLAVFIITIIFIYKTRKRWRLALRVLFKGEKI